MARTESLAEKQLPGIDLHHSARETRAAQVAIGVRFDEFALKALPGQTAIFPHPVDAGTIRGMAWHVPGA